MIASIGLPSLAQQLPNEGIEDFYRPLRHGDLITKLPPRADHGNRQGDFLSGEGCPEDVLIGSVEQDTPVFGDIDIEVIIENDIFIECR